MSSNQSLVTLEVYNNCDWPSSSISTLWGREMIHHFLPRVGDRMAILTSEEENNGSVYDSVVDIHFGFDGTPTIVMRSMILDPDERGEQTLSRQAAFGPNQNPRNLRGAWRTEQDGPLVERLRADGWLPYDQWPGRMKR